MEPRISIGLFHLRYIYTTVVLDTNKIVPTAENLRQREREREREIERERERERSHRWRRRAGRSEGTEPRRRGGGRGEGGPRIDPACLLRRLSPRVLVASVYRRSRCTRGRGGSTGWESGGEGAARLGWGGERQRRRRAGIHEIWVRDESFGRERERRREGTGQQR